MTKTEKIKLYENVLVNIMKLCGEYTIRACAGTRRNSRKVQDPQGLVHKTLKKANPKLLAKWEHVKVWDVTVTASGKVSVKK